RCGLQKLLGHAAPDRLDHALLGGPWGGGLLDHAHVAGRVVVGDQVGERAADVDTDPARHQDSTASMALARSKPASASSARWQATVCPDASERSRGSSTRQTSTASGQRGWNGQPGGGCPGSAGIPGTTMRFVVATMSRLGTAVRSACVYGCAGLTSSSAVGPRSTTRPG